MKKLTKEQVLNKAALIEALANVRADLEQAVTEFNEQILARFNDDVQGELDKLNAVLQRIKTFAEEVANDIDDYVNERSEKWQEGDQGQKYEAWKDAWRDFDADEVTLHPPEELEMPDCPDPDELEALPDKPGQE